MQMRFLTSFVIFDKNLKICKRNFWQPQSIAVLVQKRANHSKVGVIVANAIYSGRHLDYANEQ